MSIEELQFAAQELRMRQERAVYEIQQQLGTGQWNLAKVKHILEDVGA